MLVEGQIMGGAAQGLGGILFEGIAYDKGPVAHRLADGLLAPIAADIPRIALLHSPSPLNPLGVKGVGEGGAVAPPVRLPMPSAMRWRRSVHRTARRVCRNRSSPSRDAAPSQHPGALP